MEKPVIFTNYFDPSTLAYYLLGSLRARGLIIQIHIIKYETFFSFCHQWGSTQQDGCHLDKFLYFHFLKGKLLFFFFFTWDLSKLRQNLRIIYYARIELTQLKFILITKKNLKITKKTFNEYRMEELNSYKHINCNLFVQHSIFQLFSKISGWLTLILSTLYNF